MNRKYRITTALLALVVAVSVTALAAPVAAQSVDNVDVTLSDDDGDGLDDAVTVDVQVTNDGGATVVEFGSGTTVDLSDTSTNTNSGPNSAASVISVNDGQPNENVTFGGLGATTTYTVEGDLSGQSDGDTVDVTAWVGSVDQTGAADDATASATVQDSSGGGGVSPPPGGGSGTARTVNNGETLYIDERGIDLNAGVFAGVSPGQFAQDGVPLNIDNGVVQDQSTGAYTDGTNTINIQEPEITSVRIIDLNTNERLSQGDERVETSDSQNVQVAVRYNFKDSSFIDFEVANENGLDVTSRYLESSTDAGQIAGQNSVTGADGKDYDAVFNLAVDDSGQFEMIAAAEDEVNAAGTAGGNRDVGFDDGVSQSVVVNMVDEDDVQVNIEQSSANQGELVGYDVEGLNEGEYATLTMDGDDLRDETPQGLVQFGNLVFDPVGDGVLNGHILRSESSGAVAGLSDGQYALLRSDDVSGGTATLRDVTNGNAIATVSVNNLISALDNDNVVVAEVFGVVERDGTSQSQLDTTYIDDTGIDIEAYSTSNGISGALRNVFADGFTLAEDEDQQSLTVEETEITIDSPGNVYVPGQDVDVNGTTSDGVDSVSVFVRDRDEYFHVLTESVDDAEYERTDVQLNSRSEVATRDAADILSKPGVYRYGVVDTFDATIANRSTDANIFGSTAADENNGLDSADFSAGASEQMSIRVAEPSLDADFETYNDQIFRPDGIDYTGTLIGPREYVVLFTGSRGNTFGETDSADQDGEIDEDFGLGDVRSGAVTAAILSPGRDGTFGDGSFDFPGGNQPATDQNLIQVLDPNRAPILDLTQSQVRELLLSETVEEAASDDLIVTEEFRLSSDSRTQIDSVVPQQLSENATGITGIEVGEDMVISGVTNRDPDDATIVVEAVEGPSIAELGTEVTESWGADGEWNVTIEVPESVEPGQYTIQSDDGERISEANVTISAEGTFEEGERAGNQLGELQNQIEELQTQVENLESERDELEQQVSDLESENSELETQLEEAQSSDTGGNDTQDNETDDGESTPGFTAVAALISLIAVALLAIRRQEE